ncbi:hypothetical protein [Amycolatopsis sp. cmx-11-51]|uniref:hypothetical protein n=1 Tax=unclassified Amycolatopsis TaxID=2618356 RepID=UPI0039E51A37
MPRPPGADDAAAVSLDHPDLTGEREHVLRALPGTRTLVGAGEPSRPGSAPWGCTAR